jgi:hypothetical protein
MLLTTTVLPYFTTYNFSGRYNLDIVCPKHLNPWRICPWPTDICRVPNSWNNSLLINRVFNLFAPDWQNP